MIRPGIWRRELAVPLQSIQAELNRLFDEYWQPGEIPTRPRDGSPAAAAADPGLGTWAPAIDLYEAPAELTLVVDLPGVDPATTDLSLTGAVLTIRGERAVPPLDDAAARPRVRERAAGTFYRQVTLVEEVDFDRVEAQARDGVLTVRLPRRVAAQARTIPIQPSRG